MIVAIDSVNIDSVSMDQAAALIRGEVGSNVVIDILRKGQVQTTCPPPPTSLTMSHLPHSFRDI